MKKIKKLILFLCIGTTMLSCSKDDDSADSPMDNASLITGTWHYVSGTTNGTPDPPEECQEFFAVTFRDDLTMTIFDKEGPNCDTSIQTQGTYTINGNSLSVNTGESLTGEILTLNANRLSIRFIAEGVTEVETYDR